MSLEQAKTTEDAPFAYALLDAGTEPTPLLIQYMRKLFEINQTTNLTGAKTPKELANKHIADTMLALAIVQKTSLNLSHFIDVGSGGGLPGIPLAILCPNSRVTLIERRAKKASALSEIVQSLELTDQIKIFPKQFEETGPFSKNALIWFRGFLPGPKLAEYLSKNFPDAELGTLVLMKGPAWEKERLELLKAPRINQRWMERFERSEMFRYKLPEKAGDRVLVLV